MPLPITLYGARDCDDTERTRAFLQALGVPFVEVDIDANPAAENFVLFVNQGYRSTPTLVIGQGKRKIILTEPTNAELEEVLHMEDRPKTTIYRYGGDSMNTIPGYTYGEPETARSPLTTAEFEKLKQAVLFGPEDEKYLRMAGEVLQDQVEDVLDVWYGFVASHPHLVYYFTDGKGNPDAGYLNAVRRRFGQWILDTCNRPYDQTWLDYQQEIGLRHHRTKKNKTDGVASVPHISYRYLVAFIYPITATIRPFLTKKGHSPEEVEKMHQAWFKSVVMQVALWSVPYVREGDF